MTEAKRRPTRELTAEQKANLRLGILAARVQVTLDKKRKRVTDPKIAALAAREIPY